MNKYEKSMKKAPSKLDKEIQSVETFQYENVKVTRRDNLFNYFMKNRLNTLVENIGEF